MIFKMRRNLVLSFVLLVLPLPLMAQWSDDAASNTIYADGPNQQGQPKLHPLADGGFYMSWFDNSVGGYDVRLQRIDIKGRELWPHNGVLVAHRSLTFTTDYGLDSDAQGNALLAFHDKGALGNNQIIAAKVSPDGTLMWGSPGHYVSAPNLSALSPRIAATTDGGAVVAWTDVTSVGKVSIQKLDANGVPQWGAPVQLVPSPGNFILSDLRASEDGGVILSWQAQLSFFARQLWAQKIGPDGSLLWSPAHVKLWTSSAGVLQLGYFPTFTTDGAGGGVFCWDYVFGFNGGSQSVVQHISASGTEVFPHNGVPVSTDATMNRTGCKAVYDQTTGNIYAAWIERTGGNSGFEETGIYAQGIDPNGTRLWGNSGNALLPIDPIAKTQLVVAPAANGFFAAWALHTYPSPMPIQATRINSDGSYAWSGAIVTIKTSASAVGNLTGALGADDYAAFAWQTYTTPGQDDIAAQNIGRDGVLGKKDPGATKK